MMALYICIQDLDIWLKRNYHIKGKVPQLHKLLQSTLEFTNRELPALEKELDMTRNEVIAMTLCPGGRRRLNRSVRPPACRASPPIPLGSWVFGFG